MAGNQSGSEKHNRLLLREQWMLLFSKIQDGGSFFSANHESSFLSENRIKIWQLNIYRARR